jgi:hypothetical protein
VRRGIKVSLDQVVRLGQEHKISILISLNDDGPNRNFAQLASMPCLVQRQIHEMLVDCGFIDQSIPEIRRHNTSHIIRSLSKDQAISKRQNQC